MREYGGCLSLPSTLECVRGRGFALAELPEKLHDKSIEIRVPAFPAISTPADGRKYFFQLLFFLLRRKTIDIRQAEIIHGACGKYFDILQKVCYQFDGPAAMVFQVALPDNDNIPSQRNQLRSVPVITLNIFKKFFLPEFFIRGGS